MSRSCAVTAAACHPRGEAHSPPAAFPFVTQIAQVAAPAATWAAQPQEAPPQQAQSKTPCRSCRLATTRQATLQLQPAQQLRPSVAKNASGDTKRHATTSSRLRFINCRANQHPPCLPKTIGRHGRHGRHGTLGSPAAASPLHRPSWPKTLGQLGPLGRLGRLAKISYLHTNPTPHRPYLWEALARFKEGRGVRHAPTKKLAPRTLVSPVAPPPRSRRHRNSNPRNDFGLLSPKTRSATQCLTRPSHKRSCHPTSIPFCRPSPIFVARRFAPNSRNSNNLHILSPGTRAATEFAAPRHFDPPDCIPPPTLTP